jgi:hypothetical protein
MKKIRLRTIAIYLMAIASGALLLNTSQSVQKAEDRLAAIQEKLNYEKDSIHVLGTEWAYLNNPERLEKLANEYLDLKAPVSDQMKTSAPALPERDDVLNLETQAQPVSFQAQSQLSKPLPKPVLGTKNPPEKDFRKLLKNISKKETE